jgi:hypothetical protein
MSVAGKQVLIEAFMRRRLSRTFWMAALVASRQRDNSFGDKLGRYIAGNANDADRRRKAMTALTAKMARVAQAVVKTQKIPSVHRTTGDQVEGHLSASAVRARLRPVDNVWAFHLGTSPL